MSVPKVTHTRHIGKTRDHNSIMVAVERTATLADDLKTVTCRSDGRISLTVRHGYEGARANWLLPEDARELANALYAASVDVEEAKINNDAIDETTHE